MIGSRPGETAGRLLGSVALAAAGLAALHFLLIWPASRELARLEQERFRLSLRLEEHEALLPAYAKLRMEIASLSKAWAAEERLPLDRVGDIPRLLGELAAQTGLRGAAFALEPSSLDRDGTRILASGGGTGDHRVAKAFLDELGAWPPLDGVERIEARVTPLGLELRLRVWIGLRHGESDGKSS